MKITGKNSSVNLDAYVKNIKDKEGIDASAKQDAQRVSKEDQVSLSPEVRKIQEAKELLRSVPDIREEKVAQIKAQIENGTYRVEDTKLAAKMINESLLNELL